MRNGRRTAVLVSLAFFCFAVLLSGTASAEDRLPAKQRTLLLFKSLTYDENLATGRDALKIGVVAMKGDSDSDKLAQEMLGEIKKVQHMKVRGLKINVEVVAAGDADGLKKLVGEKKLNLLHLSSGVDKLLSGLCDYAGKNRVIVTSGEKDHSKKCSAITLAAKDNKPRIIVNIKAAKAQGASLGDALLKHAEIVN